MPGRKSKHRIKTAVFLATGLCWSLTQAQVGNNDKIPNPNVADEDQLAGMTHLDAGLVDSIVEARPYLGTTELEALLSGSLNESQRADVYAELFIPINLNSASEEGILLIPEMSKRMAHEFEEYRPCAALEQFRHEIGK